MNGEFIIKKAIKSDKKQIKRFYKSHHYTASFMGFDTCYTILHKQEIIACVIISYITPENPQALLHALYVNEKYRKLNIAAKLITHVQKFHTSIVCFSTNSLKRFYQRSKFTVLEEHLDKINQNTKPDTISIMNWIKYGQYKKYNKHLIAYIYNT